MNIKEQLKKSDCAICKDALFEIIRLEAELISTNKWLDRISNRRKASTTLRKKTALKASKSAAGKALSQRRTP